MAHRVNSNGNGHNGTLTEEVYLLSLPNIPGVSKREFSAAYDGDMQEGLLERCQSDPAYRPSEEEPTIISALVSSRENNFHTIRRESGFARDRGQFESPIHLGVLTIEHPEYHTLFSGMDPQDPYERETEIPGEPFLIIPEDDNDDEMSE